MNNQTSQLSQTSHLALIDRALAACEARGATASISVGEAREWSTRVGDGIIERHEAADSRGMSITAYLSDGRHASVSTNDLRPACIDQLCAEAVDLAEAGAADEWQGLPDAADCGLADIAGLDDELADFDENSAVELLLEAERIARSLDTRVIKSHRSDASMMRSVSESKSSNGVHQQRSGSHYSATLPIIAEEKGEKQNGWAYTSQRSFKNLRSAQELAEESVAMAIEGFGWKQAQTGTVRCLLHNRVASDILGSVGSLASGTAVYRSSTCWQDKAQQQVASDIVTIIDDPLIADASGSRRADSSGILSKPFTVIDHGTLQGFFTGVYSSRRLGIPLTGHSGGYSNLYLMPGDKDFQQMLTQLGTGFYVTGLQGHGVDINSGHWSKGASGFWVENGSIAYPVQNVTLASNLMEMFMNIEAIGNDQRQESSVCSPSVILSSMQLGGAD